VRALAFLLALSLQAPPVAPLANLRSTLRRLGSELDQHRATYGATPELTTAKLRLRDWVESRLAGVGRDVDTRAFAAALHTALRGADLLCDDCDSNVLGYVDDVRVDRAEAFLVVVTAMGISCGYDESAYVYAWDGQHWRRIWEHEHNTDTQPYLPQAIHDVQISSPDATGGRLLLVLGSQTICGGAFKNLYARAWQMNAAYRSAPVLDWTAYGNDGYPPLLGRVRPDDVLFEFTAGGLASGDPHTAVRHFHIDHENAIQVDPIAGRPHDFVVEWLSAPWEESRARSESPSLAAWHAQLHRNDGVGDFPDPTLRCTDSPDQWQVGTHLYEGPKRYYRVHWQPPFSFTLVGVSDAPYPDCTVPDSRGDSYPNLLESDLH
jgi:hypothetical protein